MDFREMLIIPSFENINFSVFIGRPILLIFLFCFFLIYSILSLIIIYHWHAYGMRSYGVLIAESLFLSVSVGLFIFAGLSLTYF